MPSGEIRLHPGEKQERITIELAYKTSICGHITRDIAPGHEWGGTEGPPNIVPADTTITYYRFNAAFNVLEGETKFDTDKDGAFFRITGLDPGTYFVRSGRSTWYPGTNTFAEAKPVVVDSKPSTTCEVDILERADNFCWFHGQRQTWKSDISGRIASGSKRRQESLPDTFPGPRSSGGQRGCLRKPSHTG